MLLDVSNSGVLYVQTGARCTVSQVAYCYALGAVQAFLLHSYGFIPVMFGLLHRISAFLRLVSQRPFRVRPRWHLSVRVNQKKFIVLQLLLKARVISAMLLLVYYEVKSFLFHSYGCCSRMLRLLHHISVFSRLVVQRAFASPSLAFQRSSQSERIYTCPLTI